MDKAQAVFKFWSQFDLPVYDENTLPTGSNRPQMPYLTYSMATDSLGNPVAMSADLWYHSTSWQAITRKADEIAKVLGTGGQVIPVDGGYIYIVRGTPFSQRMSDPEDADIRRIYINIMAEYLTAY